MRTATDVFAAKRAEGMGSGPVEAWRDQASEIRQYIVDNMLDCVDQFAASATRAGAVVHRARDSESAREAIFNILRNHRAARIVKAKSMITEEIHLNEYLEARGFYVVETDLGQYIVQLAGERPSHLLAPAIHKSRREVGRLFSDKLGVPYSDDPTVLTGIARTALRKEFLSADAGISGANFAVADSGSLVIFTNEGNGRMVTALPPLHIAVLSMEKIIPSLKDLAVFARLLPRAATGQALSTYLSIITGNRKSKDSTGSRELHIVLLDNGRSQILAGEYRNIFKCIRCSACINVCPVYRTIGGHAYGATYSGPMGIILTILLEGMDKAHSLLDASTMCGACAEVCPVRVPLLDLIYKLRKERAEKGLSSQIERKAMAGFGCVVKSPFLFNMAQTAARVFWPIVRKVDGKDVLPRVPVPAARTLRRRLS
jgi:L-lactate dehydrogenase complex protein LldF